MEQREDVEKVEELVRRPERVEDVDSDLTLGEDVYDADDKQEKDPGST